MRDDAWYFGTWRQAGHYWWAPGMHSTLGGPLPHPFDGVHPPGADDRDPWRRDETQGVVRRVIVDGWTVLAFWNRMDDKRPGSNSAFVVRGDLSYDDAMARAREAFPQVFARLPFTLRVAEPGGGHGE